MPLRLHRNFIIVLAAVMLMSSAGLSEKARHAEKDRVGFSDEAEVMHEGASEPFDEPDKAAEFYVRKRAPDSNGIPVEKYLVANEHIKRMPQYSTRLDRKFPSQSEIDAAHASELSLGAWTQLGPGNIGGRTRALAIHPIHRTFSTTSSIGLRICRSPWVVLPIICSTALLIR